ncbi:hypothetical protein AXG93_1593s1210 [Marchantia polymorpha subsp. ruderalis]|uniref:Uncharacterized protein n=1 Tax=Marchantia polymorpha subsp. ruderalis TaxID=1480154 RepID=A0A176WPE2_MARPO|nr:hypothetical protein AXG93_1593s1210 [Marchantia polymorpha subsp. ruderalis]
MYGICKEVNVMKSYYQIYEERVCRRGRPLSISLIPPSSKDRVEELGRWVSRTVQISGEKWDQSSVDIAVAGVGWIAFALSGAATLEVCTWEGVAVTVREAMVFDMAAVFERPGFTALKATSKAGAQKT